MALLLGAGVITAMGVVHGSNTLQPAIKDSILSVKSVAAFVDSADGPRSVARDAVALAVTAVDDAQQAERRVVHAVRNVVVEVRNLTACAKRVLSSVPNATVIKIEVLKTQLTLASIPGDANITNILSDLNASVVDTLAVARLLTKEVSGVAALLGSLGGSSGRLQKLGTLLQGVLANFSTVNSTSSQFTTKLTVATGVVSAKAVSDVNSTAHQFLASPSTYAKDQQYTIVAKQVDFLRAEVDNMPKGLEAVSRAAASFNGSINAMPMPIEALVAAATNVSKTLVTLDTASFAALKRLLAELSKKTTGFAPLMNSFAKLLDTLKNATDTSSMPNVTVVRISQRLQKFGSHLCIMHMFAFPRDLPGATVHQVRGEFSKVQQALKSLGQCNVSRLTKTIGVVNETLFRLPASIASFSTQLNALSTSPGAGVTSMLQTFGGMIGTMENSTKQITSLPIQTWKQLLSNTTKIVATFASLLQQNSKTVNNINVPALNISFLAPMAKAVGDGGKTVNGVMSPLLPSLASGQSQYKALSLLLLYTKGNYTAWKNSKYQTTQLAQVLGGCMTALCQALGAQAKSAQQLKTAAQSASHTIGALDLSPPAQVAGVQTLLSQAQNTVSGLTNQMSTISGQLQTGMGSIGRSTLFIPQIASQWRTVSPGIAVAKRLVASAMQEVQKIDDVFKPIASSAGQGLGEVDRLLRPVDRLLEQIESVDQGMSNAKTSINGTGAAMSTSFDLAVAFASGNGEREMAEWRTVATISDALDKAQECTNVHCVAEAFVWLDEHAVMGSSRTSAWLGLCVALWVGAGLGIVGALTPHDKQHIGDGLRCCSILVLAGVVPAMLIIAAVLFVPMVMLDDSCEGIEKLIIKFLAQDGHLGFNQAVRVPASDINSHLIQYGLNVSNGSIFEDFTLSSASDVVDQYIGQAASCSDDVHDVAFALDEVGRVLSRHSANLIGTAVKTASAEHGFELRPLLLRDVAMLSNVTAVGIPRMLRRTSTAFGCQRLRQLYYALKAPVCCSVVAAIWWLAMSACVQGLLGCCGICALGCMSGQRLKGAPTGTPCCMQKVFKCGMSQAATVGPFHSRSFRGAIMPVQASPSDDLPDVLVDDLPSSPPPPVNSGPPTMTFVEFARWFRACAVLVRDSSDQVLNDCFEVFTHEDREVRGRVAASSLLAASAQRTGWKQENSSFTEKLCLVNQTTKETVEWRPVAESKAFVAKARQISNLLLGDEPDDLQAAELGDMTANPVHRARDL